MLEPMGETGPSRHVLEVTRIVTPREMFGIVFLYTGDESFLERLCQHRSQCPARRQVCDTQEYPVVRKNVEVRIIFCVVADVELYYYKAGICRHGERWTEQT